MKNIVKKVSQILTGAAAAATLAAGRAMAVTDAVANPTSNPAQEGADIAKGDFMPEDLTVVFHRITNTVLIVIGAVSVIMLIWGGLRYVISGGDSKKVTDAKNTILYAIIGLIICLLAYSIINFVITAISGAPAA